MKTVISSIKDVRDLIKDKNYLIFGIAGNPSYRNEAFFLGKKIYYLISSNNAGETKSVKKLINQKNFKIKSNPGTKKPGKIIKDKKVKKFIHFFSKQKRPAIYVMQPSKEAEKISQKYKWKLIANNSKIFEKLSQRKVMLKIFKKSGIEKKTTKISLADLNEETYSKLQKEMGEKLVFQIDSAKLSGGRGTFFTKVSDVNKVKKVIIQRKEESKLTDKIDLLVSSFHKGDPLGVMACVTKSNGILVSDPRYQLIDIKESIEKKDDGKGIFCGHDWSLSNNIPSWANSKIQKYTERVGNEISKIGYKGIFGLDFIMDKKSKQIYPIEINPRLLGSLPHEAFVQYEANEIPLVAFHILEFLNIDYKIKSKSIYQNNSKKYGAHLILFNFFGRQIKFKKSLKGGVYKLKNNQIKFLRKGTDIIDIKDKENEFVLSDGVPVKNKVIKKNRKILKIITKRTIGSDGGFKLNQWGKKIVKIVKKEIKNSVY